MMEPYFMRKFLPFLITACITAISASSDVDLTQGVSQTAPSVVVPVIKDDHTKLGTSLHALSLLNPKKEFSFKVIDGKIVVQTKDADRFLVTHIPAEMFFQGLHPNIKPGVLLRYVNEARHLRSLACQDPENPYFYLTGTEPNPTRSLEPINNIRMWISRVEAPQDALEKFVENIKTLQDDIGDVYFYIINKKYVPETLKYLKGKNQLPKIKIVELGTVDDQDRLTLTIGGCQTKKNDALPKELIEALLNRSAGDSDFGQPLYYYTAASNVLRPYVLFAHGGIYCDLGAEINTLAIEYARCYDHTFVSRVLYGSVLEGYIAGKKNSPIFRDILKVYVNFSRVPYAYIEAIDKRNTGGIGLLSSEVYPQFMLTNAGNTSWFTAPEGFVVQFNSIGTWRSDGSHGNMPTFETQSSKAKKITEKYLLTLLGEQKLFVSDPYGALISNYGYAHCPLVSKISEHFHRLPLELIKKARFQNHDKALGVLRGLIPVEGSDRIPSILHNIWLTNPEEPSEMEEYMLRSAKESCQNIDAQCSVLWTNNPNYLRTGITVAPFTQIRDIEELRTDMAGKEFFDELYGYKRFANASILLRYAALNKFGGIYADAGTLLKPGMKDALQKFDYVFSQRDFNQPENWLGENMMASKSGAPLWGTLSSYFKQLYRMKTNKITIDRSFKDVVRYIPLTQDHAIISGHALSAALDTVFVDGEETVLPCCFNSLFHSGSSGSWYGKGKFGSVNFRDEAVKVTFVHLPE